MTMSISTWFAAIRRLRSLRTAAAIACVLAVAGLLYYANLSIVQTQLTKTHGTNVAASYMLAAFATAALSVVLLIMRYGNTLGKSQPRGMTIWQIYGLAALILVLMGVWAVMVFIAPQNPLLH